MRLSLLSFPVPAQTLFDRHDPIRRGLLGSALAMASGLWPVRDAIAGTEQHPTLIDRSVMQERDIDYDGYLVTNFGATKIATARMQFLPKGDQYRIVLQVESMLADLTYESIGQINDYGLKPVHYSEQRKVAFKRRRTKKIQYVITEDARQANRRDNGRLFVPPGAQDRLSLMLQISFLARAYPDLLTGERELTIPFARIRAVTSSRWQAAKPAPISLDGRTDSSDRSDRRLAQKISRVADRKDSVDVSFWLTADKARLPLILQFSESGRSLRFVARLDR